GELLRVAGVAVAPRDRQLVAQFGGPAPRLHRDRLVRVLAELGAVDDRRPLVEQPREGAQQTRLALPALAEQDQVVAGDQRALELRDDRVLESVEAGPRVLAGGEAAQAVGAGPVAEGARVVAAGQESGGGGGGGGWSAGGVRRG